MSAKKLALIALLAVSVIGGAWAARQIETFPVDSPAERVWRLVGNYALDMASERPSATFAAAAATVQTSSIRVNGSQPLLPPGLTLLGEVTGVPATLRNSISVTVHAGGKTYSAAVNGAAYRVSLNGLSNGDMVRVEAYSQRIHYVSVIGSYGKLKHMAGEDRNLDLTDNYRLRVSPYSSSLAWMIGVALGRDASNDVEFETVTRSIQYFDMASAAHTLFLIGYEFMPLPPGFDDGWQLLQDESAFRTAKEAYINGNQVTETFEQDAIDAFFDQPDYAKFTSFSEMPESVLMLGAVPLNDVPVNVSISATSAPFSDARLLIKNSDGTIGGYESRGNGNVRFNARISHELETDGEIILTPIDATPEQVSSYTWFSPTKSQKIVRHLQSTRLRRVFVGDKTSVWATSSRWMVSYPDYPEIGSETIYERRIASATDLDQQYLRNTWDGLSGKRALPWICALSAQLEVCEYAQYRFDNNGTGAVEDLGFKLGSGFTPVAGTSQDMLSWSVDAGRLQVRIRDSDITFWSLPGGNAAADSVVYLARGRTAGTIGKALFGHALSLRIDPPSYGAAEVVGTWASGWTDVTPVRYPNPRPSLVFQRHLDGTTQDEFSEYGQSLDSFIGRWELYSQRSYDYRVRASFPGGLQWVTDCATAFASGATECAPRRARYFKPLKRAGDRIYGIEEFYTYDGVLRSSLDTAPFALTRTTRPNFHTCISSTCALPAARTSLAAQRPISNSVGSVRPRFPYRRPMRAL